jgi:hypothetical protein
VLVFLAAVPPLAAETLDLWAVVDGDSVYYEYFSDGFLRVDLKDPGTDRQRFHSISDPSVTFGSETFDGFPNDEFFRMGQIVYDGGSVPGGNGPAAITSLNLGFAVDPLDAAYVNFARWDPLSTMVDSFSGAVTLSGGSPVAVDLDSDIRLEFTFASMLLSYPGTFSIDGAEFRLYAHEVTPAELEWDFHGNISTVPEPAALLLLGVGIAALGLGRLPARWRRIF